MLKMMCKFNARIAMLFAMLMVFGPLTVSAAETVKAVAAHCGDGVIAQLLHTQKLGKIPAGKNVRHLLYAVVDKNGETIPGSKFRSAPAIWIDPDVEEDAEKSAAALTEEAKLGPPSKNTKCGATTPAGAPCKEQVSAALKAKEEDLAAKGIAVDFGGLPSILEVGKVYPFNPQTVMGNGMLVPGIESLGSSDPKTVSFTKNGDGYLVKANKAGKVDLGVMSKGNPGVSRTFKISVKDDPTDGMISMWWLLLPLVLLALLGFLGYLLRRTQGERDQALVDLEAARANSSGLIPQLREDLEDETYYNENLAHQLENLSQQHRELNVNWNDLEVLRARINEFENPPDPSRTIRIPRL